ncbi:pirin family protein [Tumidithrix elongata RA019]|uniref:Pirin family protein n=1 Tax=Tumidithrix elongata BACA0141 TaxID=2716417 RepID=A0AAW9Q1Q4_9CYAN|nr:pirin family protein [Tumidithrix elongata RA019]
MLTVRKSEDRGHANHGWLDSYHTFSFANYYDPSHMGFRDLRVINEDYVLGGKGFGTHPHKDMEIVTYVLDGALEHKDSMGNGSVILPGDVQRLTAGTGITHSEYNHSPSDLVHLLQIWILPNQTGVKPGYEQKMFSPAEKHNQLCLIVSSNGENGSVMVHQDVKVYATILDRDATVTHVVPPDRYAWVQVARGAIALNGEVLHAGDAAAVSEAGELHLVGQDDKAEVLVFDLV